VALQAGTVEHFAAMLLASDQRNREHVDSLFQRSMEHFGSLMAQTAAASEQRMLRLADDFDALRQDFHTRQQRVGEQQPAYP
jgi:hypothetical protein